MRVAQSIRALRTAVVCALLLVPGMGGAQPPVRLCTIATTSVNFGAYDVFAPAPVDSTGSVTIGCTGGGPPRNVLVTLSAGQSGSYGGRTMDGGGVSLVYNLYLDAARTSVWGDGTGGSQTYTGRVRNNEEVQITVYGRVPPGQDVATGIYTDSIVAVVNR